MDAVEKRSKKDIDTEAQDKALGLKEIPTDKLAEDIAAADERLSAIIGKLNDAGDMEFGYSEFIVICTDDDEKEDDYLGFYRIDRKEGVFAQDIPDDIRSGLTSTETSVLSKHPLKDLNKPILPFPFTAAQFKAFIQWNANRGIEIPVDDEALDEAIAENRQEEIHTSALHQQERLTQKDAETNPAPLPLLAHEDEAGPMLEEAPAAEQPQQKCTPGGIEEAKPENPQMAGLNEINNAKFKAKERAKAIADDLWRADVEEKIRISVMADKVYRKLVDEGFVDQLPGHAETLKEWINPVAPEYARKPGRPPKSC